MICRSNSLQNNSWKMFDSQRSACKVGFAFIIRGGGGGRKKEEKSLSAKALTKCSSKM